MNSSFFIKKDIKTTNAYELYTWVSMIAEIGGYVGLLLGASLVNIGRINSALLDLCFGNTKEISETPTIKTIHVQNIVK